MRDHVQAAYDGVGLDLGDLDLALERSSALTRGNCKGSLFGERLERVYSYMEGEIGVLQVEKPKPKMLPTTRTPRARMAD